MVWSSTTLITPPIYFLISLMAGNAPAPYANCGRLCFSFDPWWNNAITTTKTIDRTIASGKPKMYCHKMICKDTIEERSSSCNKEKKELSDNLIGKAIQKVLLKQLSKEDVEFCLNWDRIIVFFKFKK
jgi:SNF2 family DNA or RNA helicase